MQGLDTESNPWCSVTNVYARTALVWPILVLYYVKVCSDNAAMQCGSFMLKCAKVTLSSDVSILLHVALSSRRDKEMAFFEVQSWTNGIRQVVATHINVGCIYVVRLRLLGHRQDNP